jgi:hypothetical protein
VFWNLHRGVGPTTNVQSEGSIVVAAYSAVSKPMVGQVLGWRDGALAAHAGQHVAVGVEGDDDGGVPK